ncbi:DUF1659 domain-containing protein [Alicyclobacillus macrosporangiidus]|uniref:DUF1659 domain-containing protein n=1 Tax=Alicyclobacillus macrosporangiidus TaxID=392015 RepID=UPI000553B647|nr:DUF1659 domain-containing protein [Alicyclobacillus macrosporangiidus]MCL6597806.1 DUF1659 domain-containing protein [Alicyclobacillus macrosporangiidus]
MAQVTPQSCHLQLQFQVGTTASGMPKIQNRNYTNVSPTASDDDLLAVGQALAALFDLPLHAIARVDQDAIEPGPQA